MSATIFCEGALYGPDGLELLHPNYRRRSVPVSVEHGYHASVVWDDIPGATVSFFRLLIGDKILIETEPHATVMRTGEAAQIRLDITGNNERRTGVEAEAKLQRLPQRGIDN